MEQGLNVKKYKNKLEMKEMEALSIIIENENKC